MSFDARGIVWALGRNFLGLVGLPSNARPTMVDGEGGICLKIDSCRIQYQAMLAAVRLVTFLNYFFFLKKDFPLTNNILKVNMTIVWMEPPRNHHQSLWTLIFGDYNT